MDILLHDNIKWIYSIHFGVTTGIFEHTSCWNSLTFSTQQLLSFSLVKKILLTFILEENDMIAFTSREDTYLFFHYCEWILWMDSHWSICTLLLCLPFDWRHHFWNVDQGKGAVYIAEHCYGLCWKVIRSWYYLIIWIDHLTSQPSVFSSELGNLE